ncbi:unnamed protein product [Peniophora sp. CBMAI 1063]|nr:unnamed protein product [Peniophora sp. CBMAI 1063]
MAPISLTSLPVDVVIEVYYALVELDRPSFERSNDNPPIVRSDLGWIRLTQVGHYLRDVGLNTPTLWARDFDVFPRAFDVFLARSQTARLHLHIDLDGSCHDQIMRNLNQMVPRAMFISGAFYSHSEATEVKSRKAASQLVDALSHHDLLNACGIYLGGNKRSFVKPLNTIKAPNLTRLDLHGTYIPFTAPSLQHLHLANCRSLNTEVLVDLLRTMPRLRSLQVTDCALDPARESLEPVSLPKLASFGIGGQYHVLRTLARCISFPVLDPASWNSTFPPRIQIEKTSGEDDIYGSLACFRSRLPPNFAAPAALTLPIEIAPVAGLLALVRVLLSDSWDPTKEDHPSRYVIFESRPRLDWQDSSRSVTEFLAALARLFSSSVRAIYIMGGISRREDMFRPTRYSPAGDRERLSAPLRQFRLVTELHLGPAAGGLPDLMHGGGPSTEIVFPALQTIYLHVSRVTGYPASHDIIFYGDEVGIKHVDESWWAEFVAMLVGRATEGRAIQRLVLQGHLCHIVSKEGEGNEPTKLRSLDLESVRRIAEVVIDERVHCGHASSEAGENAET